MKKIDLFMISFALCVNCCCHAGSAEPCKIALSEIMMLPVKNDDPVKIELFNCSSENVDLDGWFMTDEYEHRYDFPKSIVVPRGAFVVVEFCSKTHKSKDDVDFADNVAYLYCNDNWADEAFRGRRNECAVFAPVDTAGIKSKLHEYIMWGQRPSGEDFTPSEAHKLALEGNIWHMHDAAFVGHEHIIGLTPLMHGGSLARMCFQRKRIMSEEWFVNSPADVSIGLTNSWPTPYALYPYGNSFRNMNKPLVFSWRGKMGIDDKFLVQVALDKNFTNLIFEKETNDCFAENMFGNGEYYWRVFVNSHDNYKKWSNIVKFEIFDSEKKRSWKVGDPRVKYKKVDKNEKDK